MGLRVVRVLPYIEYTIVKPNVIRHVMFSRHSRSGCWYDYLVNVCLRLFLLRVVSTTRMKSLVLFLLKPW